MEQLTLSLEVPHANRSAYQQEQIEAAWMESLALCSSTLELWQKFAHAGFSGRTCQEFLTLGTMRSRNFSGKFKSSGITASGGEFLMLNSSGWHSGAGVFSLSDTLERGGVPQQYFLTPKACAGILARAEKNGRSLPTAMKSALLSVCEQTT